MSDFHDIVPNFTFSQKIVIFQVYLQLFNQLLHPYKSYGRDMSGILVFIQLTINVARYNVNVNPENKVLLLKPVFAEFYNRTLR